MKTIVSRENPTFKQLRRLSESSRERRKAGKAMLDGIHLIEAYLASGQQPEMIVVSESGAQNPEVSSLLARMLAVETVQFNDALFANVAPVESPTGILAVIPIADIAAPESTDFCLLLEDIQDPGNLGSILRSAAAAGVQVVYCSTGCADVWSPKVLRGGMGAHFAMHMIERADLPLIASRFSGLTIATSLDAVQTIYDLDLRQPLALMLGNEGAGLSPALQTQAKISVSVPMPGSMESLNVAAAAAVCLFERVRQTR